MLPLQEIAQLLGSSRRAVALTGAGVSKESGIPTFRGRGGIWESYNPAVYANPPGLLTTFLFRPRRMASFVTEIFGTVLSAEPNQAHLALSDLEKMGILTSVVTQNVDNLHQEAGSRKVIELHGNLLRFRCMRCARRRPLARGVAQQTVETLRRAHLSRLEILRQLAQFFPRCACGGRCRLDVVLFGESLPHDEFFRAQYEIDNCDILLLVGTSGVVYPAARLPHHAKAIGAKVVEINPRESPFSQISDHFLRGKAAAVLPKIVDLLRRSGQS